MSVVAGAAGGAAGGGSGAAGGAISDELVLMKSMKCCRILLASSVLRVFGSIDERFSVRSPCHDLPDGGTAGVLPEGLERMSSSTLVLAAVSSSCASLTATSCCWMEAW